MREKIISNFFKAKKNYSAEKAEKIKYQLECLYTFGTKFLVLLAIAFITKILDYFFLLILFMFPLRIFGFGFHAKTNFSCWIISTIMYSIIPLIIKLYQPSYFLINMISVISVIIIIIFSPASSNKKPLLNHDRNKKRKIIISIITILYFLTIISVPILELKKSIFLALIYQAFLVNPITYKMFNN